MLRRPRNRQGRGGPSRGQNRGGRGGRGSSSSSGGFESQRSHNNATGESQGWRQYSGNVPKIQQVVPGAAVSIVLKMDQDTGREVQGFVAEVLTAGDHPRGIKVRLRDGRVGRVQKIVSEEEATAGSEGLSSLGRNGEQLDSDSRIHTVSASTSGRFTSRYTDFRFDNDGPEEPPTSNSLEAYIKPARGQKKRAANQTAASSEAGADGPSGGPIAVCPVCNDFEGDEAAVAHHVEQHFSVGD